MFLRDNIFLVEKIDAYVKLNFAIYEAQSGIRLHFPDI